MGCTNSKADIVERQPNAPLPVPIKIISPDVPAIQPPPESIRSSITIKPGQMLLSRDHFQSKYSGEWMHKWRRASVVEVDDINERIKIHYDGWSDNFDLWIDLNASISSIAPVNLLTKDECDRGVALDANRIKKVQEFVGLRSEALTKEDVPPPEYSEEPPPRPQTPRSSSKSGKSLKARSLSRSDLGSEPLCPAGTMLDVLDIYFKAGSHQQLQKWRKARVVESHGTEIRINFIGWDSKFDETLDLLRDSNRISEFGTKSTEQTSKSVAMNRSPSSLRKSLTGNFISPSKSPITSVASPGSDIKKPLVDSTDGLTSPASATKTPHRSGKVKFSDDDAQIKNASSQESDSTNVTGVSVASGGRPTHGLNRAPSIENRISITSDSGSGSNLVPSTTQPKGAEQAHVLNIPAAPAVATDVSTTANDANTSKPNAPVKPVTESKETKSGKGFSLFRGAVKSSEKMIADSSEASTSATKSEKGSKGSADGNGQSTITTESNSTDNARPQSSYYTNSINASRAIFKSIMQFVQSKKSDGSSSGALGNGTDGAAKESKSLEDKQVEELMAQTAEEMKEEIEREKKFIEELGSKGLHVIEVEGDGNCLFRAVSHQLFLNEDHHEKLRAMCVEHLKLHRDRFAVFVADTDFDEYVEQMQQLGTWGDDLEIRALEEIIDRNIRIYASDAADPSIPINNNFEEEALLKEITPLSLSYHGSNHYNSIYDEHTPLPLSMLDSSVLLHARMKALDQHKSGPFIGGSLHNPPHVMNRGSPPRVAVPYQQPMAPPPMYGNFAPPRGHLRPPYTAQSPYSYPPMALPPQAYPPRTYPYPQIPPPYVPPPGYTGRVDDHYRRDQRPPHL